MNRVQQYGDDQRDVFCMSSSAPRNAAASRFTDHVPTIVGEMLSRWICGTALKRTAARWKLQREARLETWRPLFSGEILTASRSEVVVNPKAWSTIVHHVRVLSD